MLENTRIDIDVIDTNQLRVRYLNQENDSLQYAFYIYRDNKIIAKYKYSSESTLRFWMGDSGEYWVKVFVVDDHNNKVVYKTDIIIFDAKEVFGFDQIKEEKKSLYECLKEVSKEIRNNLVIISRMATFDLKIENKDTYLGRVWAVLTPLIQICIYWLVFGVGIRNGRNVDGYPYIVWMITGIIPWFYIDTCILQGANSIYTKINQISKMKFPIVIIPISKIIQELFKFIIMIIVMCLICVSNKVPITVHWLNLVYYSVYMIVFLASMAMVTSVFTMIARDFYKFLVSFVRLIFYVTPILWQMQNMPALYQKIVEITPVYYIITGFRNSILYYKNFWEQGSIAVIMWLINVIVFIWGCSLQVRYKYRFIDLA